MAAERLDIRSMLPGEIEAEIKSLGLPSYRAKQIFRWLSRGAESFSEMSDIPRSAVPMLEERFRIDSPHALSRQVSSDGTEKILWELSDKNTVESVVMSYKYGNTICVSSQVGCRMGCAFCASTIGGLVRNLTAGEILSQIIFAEKETGKKISHVVMMGIGEPLDNMDNVLRFLSLCREADGVCIGMRNISLSTCGLTEKIDKLADYNLQLTLSVSLHGPDDETRSRIMPVNRAYGVKKVLGACERYFQKTGRRISFEYAMIDGVNDSLRHAQLLADAVSGAGAHVNLIRLNEVEGSPLHPSTQENLKRFTEYLRRRKINVTVRRRLGRDISAACGQLRRKKMLQSGAEDKNELLEFDRQRNSSKAE
ncbi:MAG: 23S rRNA (adenine(2503)-C(2))-methyltransferase RlmN [Oscillospiraceae bacterium]|nr:23S rRNA (adenine(2503)-C(2))-methyltransferase RlmN [Oscillospiraceae bacterium]